MFQPYFSRGSIHRLEPTIVAKVSRLVDLICQAAAGDEAVDLSYAYRYLIIDNTNYCFGKPFSALEATTFKDPLAHALLVLTKMGRFEKYIPRTLQTIFCLITVLPRNLVRYESPELSSVQAVEDIRWVFSCVSRASLLICWPCLSTFLP
jgi:hypothetical protein